MLMIELYEKILMFFYFLLKLIFGELDILWIFYFIRNGKIECWLDLFVSYFLDEYFKII